MCTGCDSNSGSSQLGKRLPAEGPFRYRAVRLHYKAVSEIFVKCLLAKGGMMNDDRLHSKEKSPYV